MCITQQERLRLQRATKVYQETQRRKSELPEKDKRLFEQLEKVRVGRYNVSCSVILMIAEVYGNSAIDFFNSIFRLGFMKGQRAEKARRRKSIKEKQEGDCIKRE